MKSGGVQLVRRAVKGSSQYESKVGYSRAVRVGPMISVAGTTALGPDGSVTGTGDAYAQAHYAIRKIEAALRELGAELENVIRTRIYVTDIGNWENVGKAHEEFFGEIRPVSTLVQVSGLVLPEMLVEIEVDAWVD